MLQIIIQVLINTGIKKVRKVELVEINTKG